MVNLCRTDKELQILEEHYEYLRDELITTSSDINTNDDEYLANELFERKIQIEEQLIKFKELLIREHQEGTKARQALRNYRETLKIQYILREKDSFRSAFWTQTTVDPYNVPQLVEALSLVFTGETDEEKSIIEREVACNFPHIYSSPIRFVSWKMAGPFRKLFMERTGGQKNWLKNNSCHGFVLK